jgi:serine protease
MPLNASPQASFSVNPVSAQVGVDIAFDAGSSSDADGVIVDFLWQFGDGSIGHGAQTVHRYASAGDKTITLTLTDDRGGSAQLSKTLTVQQGFSLSGEIRVAGNIFTDSDVNDPVAPFARNDTTELAQQLPNPAIVNGFVSSTGSARIGDRFATVGDEFDVYRVELQAGQRISLQIMDYDRTDPRAHDVDLFLFDENNKDLKLLGYSDEYPEFESIVVPADFSGTATIRVESVSGINKYVLRVGNDLSAGRAVGRSSSVDFIPNQVLIGYRDGGGVAQAMGVNTRQLLFARQGIRSDSAAPLQLLKLATSKRCRQVIEQLRDSFPGYHRLSNSVIESSAVSAVSDPQVESDEKYITLKLHKSLRKRSDVAYAEPNHIIRPSSVPNDSYYSLQWHFPLIHLPGAWDISSGQSSSGRVVVAVVDSGVLLGHPDLAGQIFGGYDFIQDPLVAADGDGIDSDPDDVGDREGPSEQSSFHGTHVAGTIAARGNNSRGVAGIAWDAAIMPIRVLGIGGGSEYDLIQGILYAAGLANDSGRLPPQRADIINLSLGCSSCDSEAMQNVISEVRAAGVILVAAAGNNNSSEQFFPAAYDGVVAVSAVNSASELASYSNYGSYIDVAAPGGDEGDRDGDGTADRVISTMGKHSDGSIDFLYGWSSGTSMAAPHVAGVAALMKAVYPELTPTDFDQALVGGAAVRDLGPIGRDDQYGHGIIDALKAVQEAQALSGGQQPGIVTTNPSILDFTPGITVKTFELNTYGADAPRVTSVSADQPWIDVEAGNGVNLDGIGVYIVRVDPSALDAAVHQGKITVLLSDNTSLVLTIYLQVVNLQSGAGNPGLLYVLLQDANTMKV